MPLCILTGNHLSIYIWFGSVQIGILILSVSRCNLAVVFKCLVAMTDKCLCTDNPCIVVAEDTCIFLIASWIGGDFTIFDEILGECRLIQTQTMFRIQPLVNRFQCLQIRTDFLAAATITAKPCGSMKILPSSHS